MSLLKGQAQPESRWVEGTFGYANFATAGLTNEFALAVTSAYPYECVSQIWLRVAQNFAGGGIATYNLEARDAAAGGGDLLMSVNAFAGAEYYASSNQYGDNYRRVYVGATTLYIRAIADINLNNATTGVVYTRVLLTKVPF